jgi:hypothetical protein
MVGRDCADGAGIFNVGATKRLRACNEIRSGQPDEGGSDGPITKASFQGLVHRTVPE